MKANTISILGNTYRSQRKAASIFGIPESTLRDRIKNGWDIEAALTAPNNGEVRFGHRDTYDNTYYKVVWSKNEVAAHDIARFYYPKMSCLADFYSIIEVLNNIFDKALNNENGLEILAQFLLRFYLACKKDRPGYDEAKLSAEKMEAARNIANAIIHHDIVNPYCDEIFLKILKLFDTLILFDMHDSKIITSNIRIMFQESNWTDCDWLD